MGIFLLFFEKGFLNALKEAKIPFCTRMRFNAIFFIKGAKRGLKQKNATSSITEPRMAFFEWGCWCKMHVWKNLIKKCLFKNEGRAKKSTWWKSKSRVWELFYLWALAYPVSGLISMVIFSATLPLLRTMEQVVVKRLVCGAVAVLLLP